MKQKYSIQSFFNQLKESKNESISFFIKGITPADQGLEFLKENISDLSEYNFKSINQNLVVLYQNGKTNLSDRALIQLEEKDDGFNYTLCSPYQNEILLKYLLEERGISNYQITNNHGFPNKDGQNTLIVNIPQDRFIHIPDEFNDIGYTLRPKLS